MGEERVARRLAAILAADVAGYSRLMGADEEGTLSRLNAYRREFLEPKIADYRGRVVNRTGDGLLIEFASAVDAARCAFEVQRGMIERNASVPHDKRIEFRVGIHVGDVIIEDGDIFGDGVNIAARLEGIAQPGGICISDDAYRQVRGKLDAEFQDAGEYELKNIAQPVRVYQMQTDGDARTAPAFALPDKPSIAVLPFQNMSGDPEQEYFCDGIAEDIITALSRFRHLFVIARNSSFTYKGRSISIVQVGRELGVRYVLEGSVRKSGTRLRITGQLVEASSDTHLWADRFDGEVEDIFELQDRITERVVGTLVPRIQQAEIDRSKRKAPDSLDAYDYYLRALASLYRWTKEATSDALKFAYKAIEIDPEYGAALALASWCYLWRKSNGWTEDRAKEYEEAERLARRAAACGKDDATALRWSGDTLAFVAHDVEEGLALLNRALALNPNLAPALHGCGWVNIYSGDPETAINRFESAMRLNPLGRSLFGMQGGMAFAHFFAGRYDTAVDWAEKSLRENPGYLAGNRILAASLAMAGRLEEAQKPMARLRSLDPKLRVADLKDLLPLRRQSDAQAYEEGLRRAGLPE